MTQLEEYAQRYDCIEMRREDGVLEVRFHTDGGPILWGRRPHQALPMAFADIAADASNRVIILTGTGDEFIDRFASRSSSDDVWPQDIPPTGWALHDRRVWEGDRLLRNLLDIEVPVIAAVNGPARVHAELALVSDIVVASQTAVFGDRAHLRNGTIPGDGVHVIWPMLIGQNRARHMLWTEREFSADEALALGLVGEVVSPDAVLERAWEHARRIAAMPRLTVRYTRALLTRPFKKALLDELSLGMALEGIGMAAAKSEARWRASNEGPSGDEERPGQS
jgi:enoyl-CoA hydratase/carnithine racemase